MAVGSCLDLRLVQGLADEVLDVAGQGGKVGALGVDEAVGLNDGGIVGEAAVLFGVEEHLVFLLAEACLLYTSRCV